jgi:hypothetical protein
MSMVLPMVLVDFFGKHSRSGTMRFHEVTVCHQSFTLPKGEVGFACCRRDLPVDQTLRFRCSSITTSHGNLAAQNK